MHHSRFTIHDRRSMNLLDGKTLAATIREELKEEIKRLGIIPGLAVLLIGDDAASHTYVALKEKAAAEAGIHFEKILLPQNIDEELVLAKIDALNHRRDIHGIIVQLPLPPHLDENRVTQEIFPEKDADGFHPKNIELLMAGTPRVVPNLLQAILRLLESTRMPLVATRGILVGKRAVILANSDIFANPLSKLLADHGIQVDIKIKLTTPTLTVGAPILSGVGADNLSPYEGSPAGRQLTTYDILIAALGKPHVITKDMIKDGAIVIDVGTTRVKGKIQGDVHPNVSEKAGWLTPVRGGVGPLTVAYLLKNVVEAAKR